VRPLSRMRSQQLALVLALAAAAGCSRERAPETASHDTTAVATVTDTVTDAASYRALVAQSLGRLRPGTSLDAWRREFPGDSIWLAESDDYDAGVWCSQAVSEARLPRARATRHAFFYRLPPADSEPPALTDAVVQPGSQCRLGMIVVDIWTRRDNDTMIDGVADEIRRMFGGGRPLAPEDQGIFTGIGQRWQADSALVGVGRITVEDPFAAEEDSARSPEVSKEIYAFAALPVVDSADVQRRYPDAQPVNADSARIWQLAATIDSAAAIPIFEARHASSLLTDSLRRMGRNYVAPREYPAPVVALIPALVRFLDAPRATVAANRATVLAFADFVLDAHPLRVADDSETHAGVDALNRLGANLVVVSGNRYGVYYNRALLDSARAARSRGLAGDMVIIESMRRGQPGACDMNLDSLIASEEHDLPLVHDDALKAEMHAAIGEGYAHQAWSHPDPAARDKAVAHYRAALVLDRDHYLGERRRIAYELWRMVAGLAPWQHYFLDCGE
jgi:hypothetical protein